MVSGAVRARPDGSFHRLLVGNGNIGDFSEFRLRLVRHGENNIGPSLRAVNTLTGELFSGWGLTGGGLGRILVGMKNEYIDRLSSTFFITMFSSIALLGFAGILLGLATWGSALGTVGCACFAADELRDRLRKATL